MRDPSQHQGREHPWAARGYWGLGCVRWWWVYFKYGSVQQIMSLIFVRIWHTHENSDSFDTLKQDKIRLDTFGIFWHRISVSLTGSPRWTLHRDVVWCCFGKSSNSLGGDWDWIVSQLPRRFIRKSTFCFGTSASSLWEKWSPSSFCILCRPLSAISPNAESLSQRKRFLAASFCLETSDPCDPSLIKQNFRSCLLQMDLQ